MSGRLRWQRGPPRHHNGGIPSFIVALDDPPAQRWLPVLRDPVLRLRLRTLLTGSTLENLFADAGGNPPDGFASRCTFFSALADNLFAQLHALGPAGSEIVEELRGSAVELAVDVAELALLHLLYETEGGGCTSVIAPAAAGNGLGGPLFGRVLDWDFVDVLRPLSVHVKMTRGGTVVLEALTFAGFVGVLTGRRPGVCAASINFRREEEDVPAAAGSTPSPENPAWPAALLLRAVLQQSDHHHHQQQQQSGVTFASIRARLSGARLWAPCYFCLAGPAPGDACVLAAGAGQTRCKTYDAEGGGSTGVLVQCNVDQEAADIDANDDDDDDDEDFMASRERTALVHEGLAQLRAHARGINTEQMWEVLGLPRVLDSASVHACVFGACVDMQTASVDEAKRENEYGSQHSELMRTLVCTDLPAAAAILAAIFGVVLGLLLVLLLLRARAEASGSLDL